MSEYVMNLRKLVGNIPLVLVATGAIVIDEENKVLLQRRSDDGMWGLLGGSIELGETVEEATIREVFEESGLIVEEMKLFKIFSGEEQHYFYPNGHEVFCVNILYISKKYHGELNTDNNESLELQFFNINEIPENITPCYVPMIKDIKEHIQFNQ